MMKILVAASIVAVVPPAVLSLAVREAVGPLALVPLMDVLQDGCPTNGCSGTGIGAASNGGSEYGAGLGFM